jgi:His-Xaa-Ser system protein HxsD
MLERHVTFDRECHSSDAIQRAAYKFSDRMSIDLRSEEHAFHCMATLSTEDEAEASDIVHEFKNEVLDQVLRGRIRDETAAIRNTILALAFSKTSLVQQD